MHLLVRNNVRIYFGDASDQFFPDTLQRPCSFDALRACASLNRIIHAMHLNYLVFAHQVHGVDGFEVRVADEASSFDRDADFLITRDEGVGLGVLTADCVPLVLHDPVQKIVSIIHAGWRGAAKGIVLRALRCMQKSHGSRCEDIRAIIGPSAQLCCYEVSREFEKEFGGCALTADCIVSRAQTYFFDLPGYIRRQLIQNGVADQNIDTSYSQCTICNTHFFSHRRQKSAAGRNITIATMLA